MHQGPVQGEAKIADLTGSLGGTSLRSSVPPRRQRGNGAFHQAELPLSCSLEGTKVAGLEAEIGDLPIGHKPGPPGVHARRTCRPRG